MNTLAFLAFVLIVIGFLYSISGERSNRIPDNEAHRVLIDDATCLTKCHNTDGIRPRGPKHPPKDQCLICHKTKKVRKFKD